jgi:hypothetical protein
VSLLVLDTSAIKAFAAGSVDVGEAIAEVRAEGGRVLIPIVCLIEAARHEGGPASPQTDAGRPGGRW